MLNINGNVPSIKNSNAIDQTEIQKAKQNMNSVAGKSMILGAQLSNTTSSASQGNMTNSNSVPNLNSSTSVGTQELQNVKNEIQNSGSSKGFK